MFETCPVCNSKIMSGTESCPSCGFNLCGSTLRIQPINVTGRHTPIFEKPEPSKARFIVIRGEQINTSYPLENRAMSIGRAPKNDIFLNDMTVSSIHAEIFPRGSQYILRDRGSFNGIWVNNKNVTEQALNDGDIIQIGKFCLLFEQ